MTETPESRVVDPGFDEGIAKLTPEKIQAAVRRVLTKESAARLKIIIEKAIEDHKITRAELDQILNIASEDSHLDRHEQALLEELQDMIESKAVKVIF